MSLVEYKGYSPSNVSKDAKYTVTAGGEIRLVYRLDTRTKELLTTSAHPRLVDMVNLVKIEANGVQGGVFYINEFGDVLVPNGGRSSYWAGHYEGTLEFEFEDSFVSPKAPRDLLPGDEWPGPHAGIVYVLTAGAQDVKYRIRQGRRETEVFLSDHVGADSARAIAKRVAMIKGPSGGRFYINERRELFAPTALNDYAHFLYIGHLEDSAWFEAPAGYERP